MESKKGRTLDPRVIRGKEKERGKVEKVQLERRGLESDFFCHATRLQWICFGALGKHMKLIGVYFSPHVEWLLMCHILLDGCKTSQLLSHSPSFNLGKNEDTKKAWRACFFKTHPLIKYAYSSSANYGQLNFHKARGLVLTERGSLVNLTTALYK